MRFSVAIPLGSGGGSEGELQACKLAPDESRAKTKDAYKKPSFWSQLGDVFLAGLIFSTLDYAYFNWLNANPESLLFYRAFQVSTQVGLSAWLFYKNGGPEHWEEGLKVAGAFNLQWWTFTHDLMYYAMGEISTSGYFANDMKEDGWAMRHAKWTAYGLVKSAFSGEKWGDTLFTRKEILGQAVIGQIASIALLALDFSGEDEDAAVNAVNSAIASCREKPVEAPSSLPVSFMPKLSLPIQNASGSLLPPKRKDAVESAFDKVYPLSLSSDRAF